MSNNESHENEETLEVPEESEDNDQGQAIQINDNTIEDPEPVSAEDFRHQDVHGRRDVPESDQALQINDNTIADQS